jgi:hypothetical protein
MLTKILFPLGIVPSRPWARPEQPAARGAARNRNVTWAELKHPLKFVVSRLCRSPSLFRFTRSGLRSRCTVNILHNRHRSGLRPTST